METNVTPDIELDKGNSAAFQKWCKTPGGRQLLKWLCDDAAHFARRFLRTGQRVSLDYLYHRQRDRMQAIRLHLAKRRVTLPRVGGYRLNNNFTSHISRYIIERNPTWDGMFEQREIKVR